MNKLITEFCVVYFSVGQSALPGGLRQLDMDEAFLVCVVDFELRFVYMLMTRASSINGK